MADQDRPENKSGFPEKGMRPRWEGPIPGRPDGALGQEGFTLHRQGQPNLLFLDFWIFEPTMLARR